MKFLMSIYDEKNPIEWVPMELKKVSQRLEFIGNTVYTVVVPLDVLIENITLYSDVIWDYT